MDGIESLQCRVGEGLGRQLRGGGESTTYGTGYTAMRSVSTGSAWRLSVSRGDHGEHGKRPHIASPPASRNPHRQALPALHPALPCPAPPPQGRESDLPAVPACLPALLACLACLPACSPAWLSVSVDNQRANHLLLACLFDGEEAQVDSHLISASWRRCHHTP